MELSVSVVASLTVAPGLAATAALEADVSVDPVSGVSWLPVDCDVAVPWRCRLGLCLAARAGAAVPSRVTAITAEPPTARLILWLIGASLMWDVRRGVRRTCLLDGAVWPKFRSYPGSYDFLRTISRLSNLSARTCGSWWSSPS